MGPQNYGNLKNRGKHRFKFKCRLRVWQIISKCYLFCLQESKNHILHLYILQHSFGRYSINGSWNESLQFKATSTFHLSKSPLPKFCWKWNFRCPTQHFIRRFDEDASLIINKVTWLVCYSIFESVFYKITVVANVFILRFFM